MKEIEVKILDINRKEIEKKLISLGAKKIFEGVLEARYFDFKDFSLKKKHITLRLRKEAGRTVLTFKKKIADARLKIREEREIEVSDFNTAKTILKLIGLKDFSGMKKERTSYALKDVKFEIEKYLGNYSFVPEFVEIESERKEILKKYVKLLGFNPEDCKPWTMIDTVRHYQKKKRKHGAVNQS